MVLPSITQFPPARCNEVIMENWFGEPNNCLVVGRPSAFRDFNHLGFFLALCFGVNLWQKIARKDENSHFKSVRGKCNISSLLQRNACC
ncbi:hypothetical protein JTE90_027601 [Oedothorax gibbosus]|uniref:Uncharacterized protein n=1 Tax=Oedothorax gibbosus TaxID=931172 RepID=A0AAV6VM47_9ARAC|nr:hypothetical protein JTE90_027601 [Oedothorax gibbosus]